MLDDVKCCREKQSRVWGLRSTGKERSCTAWRAVKSWYLSRAQKSRGVILRISGVRVRNELFFENMSIRITWFTPLDTWLTENIKESEAPGYRWGNGLRGSADRSHSASKGQSWCPDTGIRPQSLHCWSEHQMPWLGPFLFLPGRFYP